MTTPLTALAPALALAVALLLPGHASALGTAPTAPSAPFAPSAPVPPSMVAPSAPVPPSMGAPPSPSSVPPSPPASSAPLVDAATLARIRDAALASDYAWQRLTSLADRIGPRLQGSPQAELAVDDVAGALRAAGLKVELQPMKTTHWVRGDEAASVVEYPGRPAGNVQPLHLTALGGSAATPAAGIVARVIVVERVDDLAARAAEVKGNIVLFHAVFDQHLADNGYAGPAYGQAGQARFEGPAQAAKLGAAAALVRSIGGATYRLPHTGATTWEPGQKPIPAAALAAEDADLVARLAAQGPVTIKLTLGPKTLPDVDSHNVLADLVGRERPEEIVIVSGHLDSWDLGTGAVDDGMGVAAALGAVEVLARLGLHARRTVRFVAWMGEENGLRGSKAYFESVKDRTETHVAAIESDFGVGRALGIIAAVAAGDLKALAPVTDALRPLGATVLERQERGLGADIGPLQQAGVPGFAPLVDARRYFDLHHTAADTLDKVDPDDLRRLVAVLAVLAYTLAEEPQPLQRFPVSGH